jgi:prepilin-type N-terminal cleavage/methylation domain-containing protein
MRTRTRGFTLVELLVVIAILAILAGIVAVDLIPMKKKAYVETSRAFIQKVSTAIDGYQNEFRDLPPDGFDNEGVGSAGWKYDNATPAKGVLLGNAYYKNSAVLVYFLCHPITNVTFIGSDIGQIDARQRREKPLPPFLVETPIEALSMGYHDDAFDIAKNPGSSAWNDAWNVCELVDAWGRPIDYDKIAVPSTASYKQTYTTGNNVFMNAARCHPDQDYLSSMLDNLAWSSDDERCCPDHSHDIADGTIDKSWHKDPRAPAFPPPTGDGCLDDSKAATPRNAGGCDLWSHGPSWTNPRNALANWK